LFGLPFMKSFICFLQKANNSSKIFLPEARQKFLHSMTSRGEELLARIAVLEAELAKELSIPDSKRSGTTFALIQRQISDLHKEYSGTTLSFHHSIIFSFARGSCFSIFTRFQTTHFKP